MAMYRIVNQDLILLTPAVLELVPIFCNGGVGAVNPGCPFTTICCNNGAGTGTGN